MHTVAIVQARMTSTRLPGKMLAPLHGRPLLAYAVEYAQMLPVDDAVLAIPEAAQDDVLELWGRKLGVQVLRGSHEDVAVRFAFVARQLNGYRIVRVCGDAPFQVPELGERLLDYHNEHPHAPYVGYATASGYPHIQTLLGIAPEVFTEAELYRVLRDPRPATQQHVTYHMYADGHAHMLPLPPEYDTGEARAVDTADQLDQVARRGYHRPPRIEKSYAGALYGPAAAQSDIPQTDTAESGIYTAHEYYGAGGPK